MSVALVMKSWPAMVVAMAATGVAACGAQPAVNLFLHGEMNLKRLGTAFGIKQSAVPLATLLGGLAVPSIALTVGWRWTFVGAAVFAAVAGVLAQGGGRRRPNPVRQPKVGGARHVPLLILGLGLALGVAAASSLTTYLVTAAVAAGMGRAAAGLLLALASGGALAARVVAGRLADRRGGQQLALTALMLSLGTLGYVMLAIGSSLGRPILFLPGACVAFVAGWGWNGLFTFAIVEAYPTGLARATGVTQVGGRLGSVVGPLAAGLLVAEVTYASVWIAAAVAAGAGAGIMLVGRELLSRKQQFGHHANSVPVSLFESAQRSKAG